MDVATGSRWVRRWLRGGRIFGASALIAVAAAGIVISHALIGSLTLSRAQVIERDLGRFDGRTTLDIFVGTVAPGEIVKADIYLSAASAVLADVVLGIESPDVRVAAEPERFVNYFEMDWRRNAFDARYRLVDGRWPISPNEVVLTDVPASWNVTSGHQLAVFAGSHLFDVVGIGVDRYARFPSVLAAPGTWQALDPELVERTNLLDSIAVLYWNDNAPLTAATRMEQALRSSGVEVPISVADRTVTTLTAPTARSWLGRLPIAAVIPTLLLPSVAGFAGFVMLDRFRRKRVEIMVRLGVDRRVGTVTIACAQLCALLAMVVLGVCVGIGAGWVCRPIVESMLPQPLGPHTMPIALIVQITAITLCGWMAATAFALIRPIPHHHPDVDRPTRVSVTGGSMRPAPIRRGFALVIAASTTYALFGVEGPRGAMYIAGASASVAALLVPDVVELILARSNPKSPDRRFVVRRLHLDRTSVAAATGALTALLSLPLGFLTIIESSIATELRQDDMSEIMLGNVALQGSGGTAQPSLDGVVATAGPILANSGDGPFRVGQPDFPEAYARVRGALGTLLVFQDTDQLELLTDVTLNDDERRHLRQGGVIRWDGNDDPVSQLSVYRSSDDVAVEVFEFPSRLVLSGRRGLARLQPGAMLVETAAAARFAVALGAFHYVDVPDSALRQAKAAVTAAGFPAEQVEVYEAPVVVPPFAWRLALAILGAVTFVAVGVLGRITTASLRRRSAGLLTLGVPPRMIRRIAVWTVLVPATVAGIAAAVATTVATTVAIRGIDGFVVNVPWSRLGLTVTMYVAATVTAGVSSVVRVRARDFARADD